MQKKMKNIWEKLIMESQIEKGTLSSPYGGTYVGEFRDGLPHGLDILKLPDGKIYDGQWIDGI
ncbi:MAG TPA: hypothetical protein EYO46_10185 [Candidatus Lambdaproteobacteria bacterium]|nr:hypothetical protein [Deltaproteobacteria bacterium]HHZ78477.1 hypothetical protein [Candidatus Lambdaproteobacteria bacterium]HIA57960.1 hypothetical protein [Candidatus Lambdaproteobacteria bacterium]HIB46556.1 hypothetical protein [Candidatus Lambdaproteobacteria bacterium]HIB93624.1 hypothetical protein [Candidatus Lambdaproteobacteria bacterium]